VEDLVIVHNNDAAATELADRTEALLSGRFRVYREVSNDPDWRGAPPEGLAPKLVVSLGGDGTLLYAARTWGLGGTPIVGVNLGRLGFLAEIEPSGLFEAIEATLAGRAPFLHRPVLDLIIERGGAEIHRATYINDAVINKGAPARILGLRLSAAGTDYWTYRADGLILATPTGSTAYNLSAGGPVAYPGLEAVLITPICPFTLSTRSVILPWHLNVEVEVEDRASDALLTIDGQSCYPLRGLDRVKVFPSQAVVRLVSSTRRRYLDTLKYKLGLFNDKGGGGDERGGGGA
jgi:NAD+ kinase